MKIKIKDLESLYINTDSSEYKQYRKFITQKYQIFPVFLILSLIAETLVFLGGSTDLNTAAILFLVIALFAYYIGHKANNKKFIYLKMLKGNAKASINIELLEQVRKERDTRIQSTIIGVRLIVWLFTFFILDSIADNVRGILHLHTLQDYASVILMIVLVSVFIFSINKVLYWAASIITLSKHIVIDYINHGMFVEYYVVLTIIDKGMTELFSNKQSH